MLFTDGLFEVEDGSTTNITAQTGCWLTVRNRMQNLSAGQLFGEVVAEIQGSCISGKFTDDMCLLGVELRRIGTRRFEPEGCLKEPVAWALCPCISDRERRDARADSTASYREFLAER